MEVGVEELVGLLERTYGDEGQIEGGRLKTVWSALLGCRQIGEVAVRLRLDFSLFVESMTIRTSGCW